VGVVDENVNVLERSLALFPVGPTAVTRD